MVTPSALTVFDDEKALLVDAFNLQETTNRLLEGGGALGVRVHLEDEFGD